MRDALEKDSRLHRDISLGNILLVKEPGRSVRRGYLIDWEVSSKVNPDGKSCIRGRVVSHRNFPLFYLRLSVAAGHVEVLISGLARRA